MITVIWNARGLGGPRALQNIKCLVLETSPDMLFISESKICQFKANIICVMLNFDNCFCVNPYGKKGGLILFWNANMNVTVLSYSQGHVDCLVSCNPSPYYFTDFYGNPNTNTSNISWNL